MQRCCVPNPGRAVLLLARQFIFCLTEMMTLIKCWDCAFLLIFFDPVRPVVRPRLTLFSRLVDWRPNGVLIADGRQPSQANGEWYQVFELVEFFCLALNERIKFSNSVIDHAMQLPLYTKQRVERREKTTFVLALRLFFKQVFLSHICSLCTCWPMSAWRERSLSKAGRRGLDPIHADC